MNSVPQTSVLRVPVQALLTAKAPAAGQHQPRCCQQLAAIPLWSRKDRKLWGLCNVSVSDKWKGKTSVQPWTPKTEKEFEFLKILSIYKKQHQNTNGSPCGGRGEKGEWTDAAKGMGYLLPVLVLN